MIRMTAEERLKQILDDLGDRKLNQKVNSVIHKFHIRANSLNHLNKVERSYFMMALYKDTQKNIRAGFNGKVQTFLLNTLAGKYRNVIRKI